MKPSTEIPKFRGKVPLTLPEAYIDVWLTPISDIGKLRPLLNPHLFVSLTGADAKTPSKPEPASSQFYLQHDA